VTRCHRYGARRDGVRSPPRCAVASKGINVALAPDGSLGGSPNLVDELRFADQVDNQIWGDVVSPQDLVEMVPANAARAIGLGDQLGSFEVGRMPTWWSSVVRLPEVTVASSPLTDESSRTTCAERARPAQSNTGILRSRSPASQARSSLSDPTRPLRLGEPRNRTDRRRTSS
jgi:hypothetical protein